MGIDFNGSGGSIGGRTWRSYAGALASGLSVGSASTTTSSRTPVPSVDSTTGAMLNSAIWERRGDLVMSQTLPNGGYQVYLWVMENHKTNFRSFNVALEGTTVATGIGTMPLASWQRYGPYPATVADGRLDIVLVDGQAAPHIMGLEIHNAP